LYEKKKDKKLVVGFLISVFLLLPLVEIFLSLFVVCGFCPKSCNGFCRVVYPASLAFLFVISYYIFFKRLIKDKGYREAIENLDKIGIINKEGLRKDGLF